MSAYEHDILFPDESFDHENDLVDDNLGVLLSHSVMLRELQTARAEIIGSINGEWDKKHELKLAGIIQKGLRAEEKAEQRGARYEGELDEVIDRGRDARYDLVMANLPFALYVARASAGIRTIPQNDTSGVPYVPRRNGDYMGSLKETGAFARVANLASERADLEDRTIVAMDAMWEAALKYGRPRENANTPTSAKFTTFAIWHIQRELTTYAKTEVGGWDVDRGTFERYLQALNEERLYGTSKRFGHRVDLVGMHGGVHPVQMLEGRRAVPIDSVSDRASDEADVFDEAGLLTLADMLPAQGYDAHGELVVSELYEALRLVLSTMSEREAGIIAMRFGLDDGRSKTLAEIGKVYGLTPERVRVIESKAMSKLRNPSRSQYLRDFLDDDQVSYFDHRLLPAVVDGALNLRTERTPGRGGQEYGIEDEESDEDHQARIEASRARTRESNLASWQARLDDNWDDATRPRSYQ